MSSQKIGIYGGTFDPVHHAHLILAREAAERFELANIVFVPAATSPDKSPPVATAEARLEMLRAATARESLFKIDECELQRPPPSYTIDTVKLLREKHFDTQLFLLIGDDNLAGLPRWKHFEKLQQMVTFIVLPRAKTEVTHEYLSVNRRIDISATEIRERARERKSVHFFVPTAVRQIMEARRLYQEVTRSNPKL